MPRNRVNQKRRIPFARRPTPDARRPDAFTLCVGIWLDFFQRARNNRIHLHGRLAVRRMHALTPIPIILISMFIGERMPHGQFQRHLFLPFSFHYHLLIRIDFVVFFCWIWVFVGDRALLCACLVKRTDNMVPVAVGERIPAHYLLFRLLFQFGLIN